MTVAKTFSAIILMALASVAQAQTIDAASARLLASNCFQCHGTNGTNGTFDALAGDGAADNYNKLKEMQGKNQRANIMYPHANGYTDAELKAIADYFSKQKGL